MQLNEWADLVGSTAIQRSLVSKMAEVPARGTRSSTAWSLSGKTTSIRSSCCLGQGGMALRYGSAAHNQCRYAEANAAGLPPRLRRSWLVDPLAPAGLR